MKKIIFQFLFHKVLGWKVEGEFNGSTKKCVIIVVPHTSWYDFFIAIFFRGAVGFESNWVGKKELFVFPFGYYFRWMGGAPLDRAKNENKVESIAKAFDGKDYFRLALSPEGTRKKVTEWKSGYYYIAQKANVPIVPIAFDYENKKVIIFDKFNITNDYEKDSKFLMNLFVGIKGKNS